MKQHAHNDANLSFNRCRKLSLRAGIGGGILCLIFAFLKPAAFWPAYLIAYLFVLGIALGALGIALLHRLTGGNWGLAISRELMSSAQMLPLLGLLILPMFVGAQYVYPWLTDQEEAAALSSQQQIYFAAPFWSARAAIYIGLWILLLVFLKHGYQNAVRNRDIEKLYHAPRLSALGLIVFWLTITFAATDWLMSLNPQWVSTIFGAAVTMGFVVSGLAFLLAIQPWLRGGLTQPQHEGRSNDLASFLLAFIMIWVYFAFSQFLIIWSGDLPHEITWYQERSSGLWGALGTILLIFHFVVPLGVLLSRDIKGNVHRLSIVTGGLLFVRLIDLVWTVLPAFRPQTVLWALSVPLAVVTVGSLCWAEFLRQWMACPAIDLAQGSHSNPELDSSMTSPSNEATV